MINWWLPGCKLPFLKIDVIFPFLQSSGMWLKVSEIYQSIGDKSGLHIS